MARIQSDIKEEHNEAQMIFLRWMTLGKLLTALSFRF